jgi:hypothetical protein
VTIKLHNANDKVVYFFFLKKILNLYLSRFENGPKIASSGETGKKKEGHETSRGKKLGKYEKLSYHSD